MKIDEYVPEIIPIKSAKTKVLIDSPPKRKSAKRTNTAVKDVFKDLERVCKIEWLITFSKA